MPATRELLEGEAYWGRIRLFKRRLYMFETALIVVLGPVLMFFSGEFQTHPFYVAVDTFLWFTLIILFLIMVESFVFRSLQIRMAKTASTKHLMTINSMKKATAILIAALLVAIIFSAPVTVFSIENSLSFKGSASPTSPHLFLSKDPMGLSRIESIDVHSETGATVYIVTRDHYERNPDDWSYLRGSALNQGNFVANPDLTIMMPLIRQMYLYVLVDENASAAGATVDFTLNRVLSPTLTAFLPVIMIIFAAANAAWIAYLWPLNRKYALDSIYK